MTWLLANHLAGFWGTAEIGLDSLGGHVYRDTLTPFGEHYGREHAASRNHAGFTGHVEDYQTGLATAVAFANSDQFTKKAATELLKPETCVAATRWDGLPPGQKPPGPSRAP